MGRGKLREFLFIITKRKENKAGNEIQIMNFVKCCSLPPMFNSIKVSIKLKGVSVNSL